jgi:hypothetical protein
LKAKRKLEEEANKKLIEDQAKHETPEETKIKADKSYI